MNAPTDKSGRWPAMNIGDAVLDAHGIPWRVLNRPLGTPPCDGLFRAMDGSGRQRYGEHMMTPVIVWEGASDGT